MKKTPEAQINSTHRADAGDQTPDPGSTRQLLMLQHLSNKLIKPKMSTFHIRYFQSNSYDVTGPLQMLPDSNTTHTEQ